MFFSGGANVGHRVSQVGGERSVDMGRQLGPEPEPHTHPLQTGSRWNQAPSYVTVDGNRKTRTDLVQIELDELVVLAAFIRNQHIRVFISQGSDL